MKDNLRISDKYTRNKKSEILKIVRDPMFRQRVVGAKKGAGSYKREKLNVNDLLNDDSIIEELTADIYGAYDEYDEYDE